MSAPRSIDDFLDECIRRADAYLVLPAYDRAIESKRRNEIDAILLKSSRLRLVLSNLPFTPSSVLARLVAEPSEAIFLRVARNPNADAATLDYIYARTQMVEARRAIANHRNATPDTLDRLAASEDGEIRALVASNRNTASETLRALFAREDSGLWAAIARHVHADANLLRVIFERSSRRERAEVLGNSNCPPDLLQNNYKSDDPLVRRKCASNEALPTALRLALVEDSDASVRAEALGGLPDPANEGEGSRADGSKYVRRVQARRSDVSDELIQRLSRDPDAWVRRWLARNSMTPDGVLHQLLLDDDEGVRRALGRNRKTPPDLLTRIAIDAVAWVRASVADRKDLPKSSLRLLEKDCSPDVLSGVARNPTSRPSLLSALARSDDAAIRRAVILNKAAPRRVLRNLCEDDYPLNRAMAVSHENLRIEDFWASAADPEPQVRFAVGKRAAACL
ncbi:MAG: hypothetical protein AB1508_14315 [Pseudomonadota bacterium]